MINKYKNLFLRSKSWKTHVLLCFGHISGHPLFNNLETPCDPLGVALGTHWPPRGPMGAHGNSWASPKPCSGPLEKMEAPEWTHGESLGTQALPLETHGPMRPARFFRSTLHKLYTLPATVTAGVNKSLRRSKGIAAQRRSSVRKD